MLYVIFSAMTAVIILLLIKLHLIKKSAREITDDLGSISGDDTNTTLRISSRDKDIRRLASSINVTLRAVRKEHLQYHQGNTELKNAITNISHDIRTPLTALYGYIDMMQKTTDPGKQAHYLSVMKDRAELMKQLTEELFRYSLIVSDESEMTTEPVFINQVLADSIGSFYPALKKKNITPQINMTDEHIIRNANKEALSRIFSNLLNNAVKYSSGDLLIELHSDGTIIFENHAPGMTPVQVERLFDRFYTVEQARNSTGLGLSISRELIRKMNGSIYASIEEEKLRITLILAGS